MRRSPVSKRVKPEQAETVVDLTAAVAAVPSGGSVQDQLQALAQVIDTIKEPLDDLYDQRFDLWVQGRAEGMTLKALASASNCSDALVAQTLRRSKVTAG